MGQALYRKYRSRKLQDIVGQEHVTATLEKAIKQGRISHAYLFTGPRGVGKTSIARILAHAINDLSYDDDSTHIDIIEIDAASNRRIDEIRELRDKVYIAPTSAKYKVYIIDEVHMLTREAFNALLKTLEEPPAHVIFILATTDVHKLPETIISRTQRFAFKPADAGDAVRLLKSIAKAEKIDITSEALELLAEHSGGSFRDSVSLFDQVSSQGGKIEADDVRRLLGIPPKGAIKDLLEQLGTGAPATIMQNLTALYEQGFQAAGIARQLGRQLRGEITNGQLRLEKDQALELLTDLMGVPSAHDPERYLEIQLLKHASFEAIAPAPKPTEPNPATPKKAVVSPPATVTETQQKAKKAAETPRAEKSATPAAKAAGSLEAGIWPQVLAVLKARHNTLYGVVRMAQPAFTDNGLTLAFAFAFHEKRIKESANRQKIADIIRELTGQEVTIECVLDKQAKAPADAEKAVPPTAGNGDISAISNIFGGAELLES